MTRAIILLMDSFGLGAADDAEQFGDVGADTFGHIAEQHPLNLPHLTSLGLNEAYKTIHGKYAPLQNTNIPPQGAHGYAQEISRGKDTPSGHWEIAGVPVQFNWGYFPRGFPDTLMSEFIARGELPGTLGNKHASGTEIINELGDKHCQTGKPIIYTSGDSVFQIAAHENIIAIEKLYELCEIARELVDPYNVGRVIARPFIGEKSDYHRTANRKDYSSPPPDMTLLDKLCEASGKVIAIGKTADIFAHRGISETIKADGNMALFDKTLGALKTAADHSLIFTNFVDFDSKYGHRRDAKGYADALNEFDARLPELFNVLQDDDIIIVAADHGCDPTLPGSDHTREYIPVLCYGKNIPAKNIGKRDTFADIGQSLASFFDLSPMKFGNSFL